MNSFLSELKIRDYISYALLLVVAFAGITALNYAELYEEYNLMLGALMCIYGVALVFCAFRPRTRIVLAIFLMTMFLFLLSRIVIPAIQGEKWWEYYSIKANLFSMRAISLSIISMCAGCAVTEIISKFFLTDIRKKQREIKFFKTKVTRDNLLKIVRIIFIVCMICYLINGVDKLLVMRGKSYEYYFSGYQSRMPFIITFPSGCMQFFLCMFLALKPSKKESAFWLLVYIISALPMLKIGVRNTIVLHFLFALVYFVLRDKAVAEGEDRWIGKKSIIAILVAVPFVAIFFGAYNYIRDDKSVGVAGPVDLLVDFAYKQGTTYDTLLQGFVHEKQLPEKNNHSYTFGAIMENVSSNSLGKLIFNAPEITDGNSLRHVYNGHSFAHDISYIVMGKRYIAGEGRGSSYIIENYIDLGYPGVILFGLFLGGIFASITILFGRRWLLSTIFLNMLTLLFFTPRAESTAFLVFLVSYKFWLCILGAMGLAWLYEKYEDKLPKPDKLIKINKKEA